MSSDDQFNDAVQKLRDMTPEMASILAIVCSRNEQIAINHVNHLVNTLNLILPSDKNIGSLPLTTPHNNINRQVNSANDLTPTLPTAEPSRKRGGVPRHKFEYSTIMYCNYKNGSRVEKVDIYNAAVEIGLDVGNFQAFSTRLNKVRLDGYLAWDVNKHAAAISITKIGLDRCRTLAACGFDGLKEEQLVELELKAIWLRRPSAG